MCREARRSRKKEFTEISGREPVLLTLRSFSSRIFRPPVYQAINHRDSSLHITCHLQKFDEQIPFAESLAAAQKH
jgi:hypothetical protein